MRKRRHPALGLILAVLVATFAHNGAEAQPGPGGVVGVALVIGNEGYDHLPAAPGSTADAAVVAQFLSGAGFQVLRYANASRGEMLAASQRFLRLLPDADVAVVYFAGHILDLDGRNFMVPTNVRIAAATDLLTAGVAVDPLIERIERSGVHSAWFFLEGGVALAQADAGGLTGAMAEPRETTIPAAFALAVEPGKTIVAADPTLGDFTAKVFDYANRPGVQFEDALVMARDEMAERRGVAPPPWVRETLSEPLALNPVQEPAVNAQERRAWDRVLLQPTDAERLDALKEYLQDYPAGAFTTEARQMLLQLLASQRMTSGAEAGSQAGGQDGTAAPPQNRPPEIAAIPPVDLVAGGAPVTVDLPDPSDPDGDALTIEVVSLPSTVAVTAGGTARALGDRRTAAQLDSVVLTPGDTGDVDELLSLQIADPSQAAVVAEIVLHIAARQNRPPVALDIPAMTVAADATPVRFSVPAPSDPDGDAVTVSVTQLPRFGEILAGGAAVAVGQELAAEALAALEYRPKPGHSGDAGAFALLARDAHGGEVAFSMPVSVTPAPSAEGRALWDPAQAPRAQVRFAQVALQALGYYDGTLDGIYGPGTQGAIDRYLQSLDPPASGGMTLRQRAELAAAAAEAIADTARATAASAEEAATKAQALAATDDAIEISWADGVYRGEVNGTTLEGYGVLQASNGQSFAGLFANNEPTLGVHLFQSDSRYAGEEQARVPSGLGVYEYPGGVVFAGEWVAGEINGLGVSESPAGVTVSGEWNRNSPNGNGAVVDVQNGRRIGVMDAGRFTALY
ncbi:MAG: caspase family protein [Alphaproteobacteria bacterium]